jgi:hypothetical protein
MRILQEEMPDLLLDVAQHVAEDLKNEYENRTVN